jgi:hypothetical protein
VSSAAASSLPVTRFPARARSRAGAILRFLWMWAAPLWLGLWIAQLG